MTHPIEAYYKTDQDPDPLILRHPNDADALIDALLAESIDNSVAALYLLDRPLGGGDLHDHELRIAVDAERNTGAARLMLDMSAWYARGVSRNQSDVLYFYTGHDEKWPKDSSIPIDSLREIIKQFQTYGLVKPTNVTWVPWPSDI